MKKFYLTLLALMMSFPALLAGEVSFYFQDGEEDDFELEYPSAYVSIWNSTEDEPVAVPGDMAYMPYDVNGATILKIYPSDFDFELLVKVEGDEDMYMLDREDNEWYLTLFGDTDGLEVYVIVYLAGQVPGGGDGPGAVEMSFIVSAEDNTLENPGEKLTISYFDRNSFETAVVTLADGYGSAEVVPGTSFTLSPEEGYAISGITTFSEDVATISEPGEGETEWYIAVEENPADSFASFFITMAPASGGDPGEEPGEEPGEDSLEGVITQISDLRWTVTWEDFDFVTALDSEYDSNYAYLTDDKGVKTILHANLHAYENPEIIFPDYGNYFTLNLEGLGLAAGDYILTIPAGYITLSHFGVSTQPNPEQQLGLTVGGTPDVPYTVRISAIDGNYFDITWDNVTALQEGDTTGARMENTATGTSYELFFLEDYMYSKANLRIVNDNILRVNVTNNYPDLPSGTYRFYLPSGYVTFNGTQAANEAIDGYEFVYNEPWDEGEVEFNGPSEDGILTLTWLDASEIRCVEDYTGDGNGILGVTVFDGTDTKVNVPYEGHIGISGNAMTIDLNGLYIADGECSVLVPEGYLLVTVGGVADYNGDTTFSFTYGSETPDLPGEPEIYTGSAEWSIEEGSTVARGTLVEVGWGDFTLSLLNSAEEATVHSPETGVLYLEYGSEVYLSGDKTKIILDLSAIPNGIYRINIPEACVEFEVDGVVYRNQATTVADVAISDENGVGGVGAEGRYRVIRLDGSVVFDTASEADLRNLTKGVYIINGKKEIR